tara:strand:- start:2942 stop:3721 length:780 start_codon:yes stop_codon:yes gene_type:complete
MNNTKLSNHENFIKKNIFFTENKWPHFNLIFDDIKKISKKCNKKSVIVSLERNSLYGDISLFAPYFYKSSFISVDCSTKNIRKRGAYNKVLDDKLLINKNNTYHFDYKNIKLKKNLADLILIPNLMHHIPNIELFFKQVKKILKKNGVLYIFEPLVRELHQEPEDYFRITPYGFIYLLKSFGFKKFNIKYEGGPFTAIGYCWDQAIQYLPKKKRIKKKKWLETQITKFKKMDKKYKKNNFRKHTSFPMSFSVTAKLTSK